MDNAHKENSVEQRRKLLKGALAASGVVTMGYSGAALASFECVTSTSAQGVPGFKKTITTSSNWAWLRLDVFATSRNSSGQSWKAVKIPNSSDSSVASTDLGTTTYFFDNMAATPVLYTLTQAGGPGTGTQVRQIEPDTYVYVIIYFMLDGTIAGFYPTYTPPSGTAYPAQGSCLTSLNPHLVQTNIRYGG